MPDLRQLILTRMQDAGITAYGLWRLVDGKVSKSLIGDYCAGRHDLTGARLGAVLDALGLKVFPSELPPQAKLRGRTRPEKAA